MAIDNFQEILQGLLQRKPFRGFVVELVSGEKLQIDHPLAAALRGGVAVFIGPGSTPHWFDHESVVQFIDDMSQTPRGITR